MTKKQPAQALVIKRDGRTVPFDREKIVQAIFKAARAVGGKDRKLAAELADTVIVSIPHDKTPTVEDVQDTVERVLIENGHAKTAKAFILYRRDRAELRKEKAAVLEKKDIDEVDKNFDVNALRVLKARYLRKSEDGRLIETPKQLFTRVAVHTGLPDLFYDERTFDREGKQEPHPTELFTKEDCAAYEDKLFIGTYALNRYHLEAVKRMYDRADRNGQMKVSWKQFFEMLQANEFKNHQQTIDDFFTVMTSKQFMANTPAIANFGNPLGMGSACFVMDVEDSIDDIMEKLKQTSIVFKAAGGMGYNFSRLRPEGDFVKSTGGVASGPLSFMELFDKMTDVIKQGGIRRGANMGILNSNHPDIEKFITVKAGNKAMRNFNISVLIMPDFWEHYNSNKPYPLLNPRNGKVIKTVNPRQLFDKLVYQAWESAEPGVIFFDKVNEYNPFYESLGPIVTTNPCGEVLLYGYESCNLGSVNVWSFAREDDNGVTVDWEGMARAVRMGVRFLDNVIDVNKWPLPQIEFMALATRKVGLGIMGVGDLLYELGLPYNSPEGLAFMEKLMQFVNYHSKLESIELAKERGPMLYNDKSFYTKGKLPFAGYYDRKGWDFDWDAVSAGLKKYGSRNGFTIVIAPTGSISMICGTSSGIEPVYSLVFEKNVKVGSFFYVDTVFEKVMKREGLYDEKLMQDVNLNGGRIQNIAYIPPTTKKTFVTAMDISPEDHIRALAAFQKWVDSSISKTNNFPANATLEDMRKSFILAYKLGCKDVTVFRDSSIKDQVLVAPKKEEQATVEQYAEKTELADNQAVKTPDEQLAVPAEQVRATFEPVDLNPAAAGMQTTLGPTLTLPKEAFGVLPKLPIDYNPEPAKQFKIATPAPPVTGIPFPDLNTTPNGLLNGNGHSNGHTHNGIESLNGNGAAHTKKHKFDVKCPNCNIAPQIKEGCVTCPQCGWGLCS